MATLSLREITQSQLSLTPIIPGQLICCTDTGNFYKDNTGSRTELGSSVIYVESLPLAPISEKIYLLKPNKLYLFDGDWVELNATKETVITKETIYDFPAVGDAQCIYIAKGENKTYRFDSTALKYYCIGSDYNDIKTINGGSSSSE